MSGVGPGTRGTVTSAPLEDYALLSDRHSAALVSRDGAVDWLCLPRFDSPAVFAALLDDGAGSWVLRPAGDAAVSRRYLDGTMVLETTFRTDGGVLTLTDALATGSCADPHRLGAAAPHLLVRRAACTEGSVELTLDFRPRPEYGLVVPLTASCEGGATARGGADRLALSAPCALRVSSDAVTAAVRLAAGQVLHFGLHWGPLAGAGPRMWDRDELAGALETTIGSWRAWSDAHQAYEGPCRDLVHHSGRVLQALSYQPSGAIVAAATTSLPEEIGGERNWDYRYAWVRDAAMTMDALWVAACPDEAGEFFGYVTSAAATGWAGSHLQIMYGVGGEHDLSERELPHLSGWRDSRPVRVGNDAWRQPQLDVYGELLETAARFEDQLAGAGAAQRAFLAGLADAAADRWEQPDHGIWEIRGEPRHFLHSKLMCWVALDRAVRLAGLLRAEERAANWRAERERIREAVEERGWCAEAGAFTQAFGDPALDASALMLPISGFLPADDPRVLATIEAVAAGLTDARGVVHRYRTDAGTDGLAGGEGGFLLCTFWLAEAQALAGRTAEARATLEGAAAHANDVGLLAEQVDTGDGGMLGNLPQAFSHIGLVNAAWALARATGAA
jgi:GH15 family glucan-1,4-alpha-glucosidase